jgi:outer membrane lipoprotein-sorting protein
VRRLSRCASLLLLFLVSASVLFSQGCARSILQTVPAAGDEIGEATTAFSRYQEMYQGHCGCCLDAEANAAVSVSGWFSNHTGKLSGYLQAMAPGYIKFVALNPLGQPVYILVTDGSEFKSLNVLERKAYLGSVYSETFKKFSPPGFEPEHSFYWLTGRLEPEELQVKAVRRDRELPAYWLQVRHAKSGNDSMVLFDPRELLVLRHVLLDEKGELLVDVKYEAYQSEAGKEYRHSEDDQAGENHTAPGEGMCSVPGRIHVSSGSGAQDIEIALSSLLAGADFVPEDFSLEVPANFEHLFVK